MFLESSNAERNNAIVDMRPNQRLWRVRRLLEPTEALTFASPGQSTVLILVDFLSIQRPRQLVVSNPVFLVSDACSICYTPFSFLLRGPRGFETPPSAHCPLPVVRPCLAYINTA